MNILQPPKSDDAVPRWREWLTQVFQSRDQHGIAWDDVYPSSVTVGTTGSNIPQFTAYNGNLKAYEFPGTVAMKEINVGFQFPHTRKDDSPIVPHIHLYVPVGDAGVTNIRWGCEYTWTDINSTGAVATTTVYGDLAVGANDSIKNNAILSFGEIDGTGKGLSSIFMCRLFRNYAATEDTFTKSVWLKSADIHVQKTWMGSSSQYARG